MALMLQSDIVEFVVGTRINEAHQDPNVPVELDLRRNIISKIAGLLENKYPQGVRSSIRVRLRSRPLGPAHAAGPEKSEKGQALA